MSINYDAIKDKFILIIKAAVGSSLAQITYSDTSVAGAVIRRRVDGPKPAMPYIDIDIINTQDEGGWSSDYGINSGGDLFYSTHKELLLNFRCHGGDALTIMNDLSGYLRQTHIVQEDLRVNLEASIVNVFDISSIPIQLSDKWIESADFNLTLNIVDTVVDTDPNRDQISTIHLNGELNFDVEGNPLPIVIDAGA